MALSSKLKRFRKWAHRLFPPVLLTLLLVVAVATPAEAKPIPPLGPSQVCLKKQEMRLVNAKYEYYNIFDHGNYLIPAETNISRGTRTGHVWVEYEFFGVWYNEGYDVLIWLRGATTWCQKLKGTDYHFPEGPKA